jgi:hypothetical protein
VPSLEQVIKGLVEPKHQVGVSRVTEASGLVAVDYLSEGAMRKVFLTFSLVNM